MHTPKTSTTAPRPTSVGGECCTDQQCVSGLRNHYFEGKRLTPDMFRTEQRYFLERRRLLNRAIHGWGIVYGYGVDSVPEGNLRVKPGVALDPCGRELLQVGDLLLKFADVVVIDKDGHRVDPQQAYPPARQADCKPGTIPELPCWLLSVHYAEQNRDPVSVKDPCHCDRPEWDHICETVRYSLREIACSACCDEFPCELTCECGTGPCCEETIDAKQPDGERKASIHRKMPFKRGGCRCLCDHLTKLQPGADCTGHLCEIKEPCGSVQVDLRRGVPLACVTLEQDDCQRWTFGTWIDACGPRRLVKRNDLLFDLIRGCDLTRITKIGWAAWHRLDKAVLFREFACALGAVGTNQDEYVTKDFSVEFSRPVRKETLLPDCFAMTVMSIEPQSGWWQVYRVPIVRVDTAGFSPVGGGLEPERYACGARIVVDGAWYDDEVSKCGRTSLFHCGESRVEIEVRGDLIIDCNGQPVDADSVGLLPSPTGNGSPGGTFFSSFRVAPPESDRSSSKESTDRH